MKWTVISAFAWLIVICLTTEATAQTGRLLFHSGFEHSTRLSNESRGWVDILGIDQSVKSPNDWGRDLRRKPLGLFRFQYAGGDTTQRRVTIETDPKDPSNQVLKYWMRHVNVNPDARYGGKGRIQANIAGNKHLRDFYYRVRVYFHSDWKHLRDWEEEMGWFILAEFWNNANWTREGHPFRIHITIDNDSDGDNTLHFKVGAQTETGRWQGLWHETNTAFAIPLEEWLTAEVYLKEGLGQDGRFYFAVTRANGDRNIIFDVYDTTHHPDDPTPDGFTHLNPMKLYTHNRNVTRVREQGGALQILWDDFELWTGRTP